MAVGGDFAVRPDVGGGDHDGVGIGDVVVAAAVDIDVGAAEHTGGVHLVEGFGGGAFAAGVDGDDFAEQAGEGGVFQYFRSDMADADNGEFVGFHRTAPCRVAVGKPGRARAGARPERKGVYSLKTKASSV